MFYLHRNYVCKIPEWVCCRGVMAILGDIHRHHISERVSCQSQRLRCAETLLLLQMQVELLYLNSTFQKYVISHFIAIGQQFQSSSRKSNYILVFHRAGTETKTSKGTLFKSLGHDFRSAKTTYSYFSTQRRWIYLYDSCVA